MRSVVVRRRTHIGFGLRLALGLAPLAAVMSASAAGAAPHDGPTGNHDRTRHPNLVKTAHVPLGNCTAQDVVMRALIPRLTFTASQPVTVAVVVHNVGSHTCTFGGTGNRYPEFIGPCGAFSL
jgi:hypothetical protein